MNLAYLDSRLELKNLSSTGVFAGYGSVYDTPDECDDIVAPGCFSDSLSTWNAKGQMPALLWQHRSAEPIGAYTRMSEDTKGLYVEGQLALKTQRGAEAYDLLKMKALSGLSVGFMTREDSMDRKTGVRTVKKADLWEVSIVTFPMQPKATIDTVNAALSVPKFESPSQLERYLRDVCSLTKSDARALVSEAKTMFRRDAADTDTPNKILAALARREALLCR